MTMARLAGRVAGGSTGPWFLSCRWDRDRGWLRGLREGPDPVSRGDDRAGPGPGAGDLEEPAAAAADEAGSGVEDAVAQGLGLGPGKRAVEGGQLEPGGERRGDEGGGEPGPVDFQAVRGQLADPAVLA